MFESLLPLQFAGGFGGTLLFFRLFGLLFAAVGALNVWKPREMASWQFRQRYGQANGTIEPSDARAMLMRVLGAFFALVGLGNFLQGVPLEADHEREPHVQRHQRSRTSHALVDGPSLHVA